MVGEVHKVAPVLDVNITDVHSVVVELGTCCLEVARDHLKVGGAAGRCVGEAVADAEGAGRSGWGQLHTADAFTGVHVMIGEEAPTLLR